MASHKAQRRNEQAPTSSRDTAPISSSPLPTTFLHSTTPPSQATPETMLWLQRAVGNQAAQQWMHSHQSPDQPVKSAAGGMPIQRYKVVGRDQEDDYETSASSEASGQMFPKNELRETNPLTGAKSFALKIEGADTHPMLKVADDHSMAIENVAEPKALFAKSQVIEGSNSALETANATFDLVALPSIKITIREKGGTTHDLMKALPRNKTLPSEDMDNSQGLGMKTYPTCNAVGHQVMGETSNKAAAIEPVLASNSETTIPTEVYRPEWHFHAAKALSGSTKAADSTDQDERNALGEDYATMDPSERERRSQDAAINEYARPEVGEAYAAYSVLHADSLNARKKWNWHYAGVVAKSLDGSDRMTLENYTRDPHFKGCKRDEQRDPNYFFQMYGSSKEQSFFKASLNTNDFVNLMVLRLRKRAQALPEQQQTAFIGKSLKKMQEGFEESEGEEDWGDFGEPTIPQKQFAALRQSGESSGEEESIEDWDKEFEESSATPSSPLKQQLAARLQDTTGGESSGEEESVEDWDKEFQ